MTTILEPDTIVSKTEDLEFFNEKSNIFNYYLVNSKKKDPTFTDILNVKKVEVYKDSSAVYYLKDFFGDGYSFSAKDLKSTFSIINDEQVKVIVDKSIGLFKSKLQDIKGIFQTFYLAENLDITQLDYLLANIKTIKTRDTNFDIYIKFPSILIKNSNGKSHFIKDLYIKFQFSYDYGNNVLRLANLYGYRPNRTLGEWKAEYIHSHIQGSGTSSTPFNSGFCFGSTKIAVSFSKLRHSEINFTTQDLETFLIEFIGYLSWESLEGGPYRRIGDISSANYIPLSGLQKYNIDTEECVKIIQNIDIPIIDRNGIPEVDSQKLEKILLSLSIPNLSIPFLGFNSELNLYLTPNTSDERDEINRYKKVVSQRSFKFNNSTIKGDVISTDFENNSLINKVINPNYLNSLTIGINKILINNLNHLI
jgi:hypothetical protein